MKVWQMAYSYVFAPPVVMNIPDVPSNGLTLVSLFAGCGGSSLGYKLVGYDVRLAVEWDTKAAAIYTHNFPTTPLYQGDIANLGGQQALDLAGLGSGELDVLDGSPPCQGFSTAGKQEFHDPKNRLFEQYVRLLQTFHPRAFVMENVSGMVKGKMRLAFAEITSALKAAGYKVSCRMLNAWWYGVPQDRKRLIWVGIREDVEGAPGHPVPTCSTPITVGQALGLEGVRIEVHPGYQDARFRTGRAPTLAAGRKPRIMEHHQPQVLEAWEASRPGQSLREARSNVGSLQSVRLDPFKVSPTQIAAHRNWHWAEPRYLTIEETKILQGFPAWFEIDTYKVIGNSVPPPMAEAIGRHVAKLLQPLERMAGMGLTSRLTNGG